MGSSLTHKVVEGVGVVEERVLSSSVHCVFGEVSSRLQVPFVEQGGGYHQALLAIPNRFIGNQPIDDTVTWMEPSEGMLALFTKEQATDSCPWRAPDDPSVGLVSSSLSLQEGKMKSVGQIPGNKRNHVKCFEKHLHAPQGTRRA